MNFSIRSCRHCGKGVPLRVHSCPHCGKDLMDPHRFMLVLVIMAFILLFAYTALVYGYLEYKEAYENLTCEHTVYYRTTVREEPSCHAICTDVCESKDAGSGDGLLLSQAYRADSINIDVSCQCTCSQCIA
jgi:hypothetical protein